LIDDHLLARKYDFSKLGKLPVVGSALAAAERFKFVRGGRGEEREN